MGLLDGLLGGIVGAEMVSVVHGLIERHGGVQGLVSQLEQNGLGATVQSWVGTGANHPVSGDQLHQAIGPELMAELAGKVGLQPQELADKLAAILPKAVDGLTGGTKPA